MAFKIWKEGNYIFAENTTTGYVLEGLAKDVKVSSPNVDSTKYQIRNLSGTVPVLDITEILKETGVQYTNVEWNTFYTENTGEPTEAGGGGGSTSYASSIIESAEDVNTKTTNTGTGWVGSTFTGSGEKVSRAYIRSSIKADVGGTVFFDFGHDGVVWNSTFPVAGFPFSTFHEYHAADKTSRYFRVRVVFDSLPTEVSILTVYSDNQPSLNSPLSQSVSPDQDATTVKAILHGEDFNSPGSYIQGKMTSEGATRTSIVSSLISFEHDYYVIVDASTTTDRVDYYIGGAGGTKVAEVLVTYKTTSKNEVLSSGVTLI